MPDILASISSAIAIAKKLKDIADKVKDAELKNLLADLSLELAEVKTQLADVINENTHLKSRIRDLESVEGEPCPRCRKRTYQLESSNPDPMTGALGGIRRKYKCSACDFTESKLVTPD